jgi:hypothetical protein
VLEAGEPPHASTPLFDVATGPLMETTRERIEHCSSEAEAGSGEILMLPPGHDAWVVGDEPAVTIDWQGASVWGRPL